MVYYWDVVELLTIMVNNEPGAALPATEYDKYYWFKIDQDPPSNSCSPTVHMLHVQKYCFAQC